MCRVVLIADDNPIVRQALCGLFTRERDFKYAEKPKMDRRQSKSSAVAT